MSEVKITIEAPGLVEAINALAAALSGKTPCVSNVGPGTEAPAPVAPAPVAPVAAPQATAPWESPATPATPPQMPQQTSQPATPVPTGYPAAAPVASQMPAQTVPIAPSVTTPAPVSAPASAPSNVPTIEAISAAGAALCEKGMMAQLVGLLQKYGCQAITQLKPEYIPAFAAELRALGAAI